jgi:hypothetical protein
MESEDLLGDLFLDIFSEKIAAEAEMNIMKRISWAKNYKLASLIFIYFIC